MKNKNKKYKRSIEDAGRISDEEYYNIMEEEVINKQRNQEKNGGVHYKVKKGDTLSKIAKQYTGNALRYDEIAKLSNIKNPDRLEIGQNIIINILMVMEMLKIIGLMSLKLYIILLLVMNLLIAVRKVNIILQVLKVVLGLEKFLCIELGK